MSRKEHSISSYSINASELRSQKDVRHSVPCPTMWNKKFHQLPEPWRCETRRRSTLLHHGNPLAPNFNVTGHKTLPKQQRELCSKNLSLPQLLAFSKSVWRLSRNGELNMTESPHITEICPRPETANYIIFGEDVKLSRPAIRL